MPREQKKTILVVDNDPDLSRALTLRLGSEGYTCVTASTGGQALARFEGGDIDLVISDLNMPGGDGIALAQSLRRVSPVPLIFITGFRDEFKRRLRSVENVTVLRKPFDAAELIDLVEITLASEGPGRREVA